MYSLIIIVSTVVLFLFCRALYTKFKYSLLIPFLTATILTIILLVVLNISYDSYMEGGAWLQKMLGPAVVALAYPLYNQRALIFKYKG